MVLQLEKGQLTEVGVEVHYYDAMDDESYVDDD